MRKLPRSYTSRYARVPEKANPPPWIMGCQGMSLEPTSLANSQSLPEVHGSVSTVSGSWFRRLFAFAGPAYLVSVGYMDPGNWATDLEGGARFGYELLWVLVLSNVMALLLQTLSARLGIVTRRDLAQACRDEYPLSLSYILWIFPNWRLSPAILPRC